MASPWKHPETGSYYLRERVPLNLVEGGGSSAGSPSFIRWTGRSKPTKAHSILPVDLGSVAEFERAMMLERQREGIAKTKQEGRYKGRAPTAMRQMERIRQLAAEGMTRKVIADVLGVSERSVYRALGEAGQDA